MYIIARYSITSIHNGYIDMPFEFRILGFGIMPYYFNLKYFDKEYYKITKIKNTYFSLLIPYCMVWTKTVNA